MGDQSEVWQTGVYANEMIKEYYEYSLNEKISRLFRNSEFNENVFTFYEKPTRKTETLKRILYHTGTSQKIPEAV